MTKSKVDAAHNQYEPLRSGIYLEEKKSSIGTGATAQVTQYRNFWVTLRLMENSMEMVLLNDDFCPTPIREIFALEIIKGPGWYFIEEGEKRYHRLRPYLDRMLSAQPAESQTKTPPTAASGNWWETSNSAATKNSSAKKTADTQTKKNWWSK